MAAGDRVFFRGASGETHIMYATANGVNVPNVLLQTGRNFVVDLEGHPECKTNIAVIPAEKPADYADNYVDNVDESKPATGGVTVPHVDILMRIAGGSNLVFRSASANMSYDEAMQGIMSGEFRYITYTMRADVPDSSNVIESGLSGVVALEGIQATLPFMNGRNIGFQITNALQFLESGGMVWMSDNTILPIEEA